MQSPQFGFVGMKDKMAKLIEITGKALSGEWGNDDNTGNGIPVLRTTNFTNEGIVNYNNAVTRIIEKKKIEEKYLRKGDIIIEKSGGSDKQPVGRVVYFDGPENTYLFNNFTGLLRVKDQAKWYPRYVFYSLFSNYHRGGTRAFQNKTTGLHNLKIDDFVSRCEVTEAGINEQIAACKQMDRVNDIIRMHQQQLQKLDELVKARFVELFGDLKSNPMEWPVVPFAEFAKIDGNMTTDYEKYADYPHIGIDSIEKGTGALKGYRTVREDGVISGKYIFTPQHIIYSKIRPNLNKVALPDFEGLCSADAYPILPNHSNCNRVFLAIALRSEYFLEYILQFSSRTNLPKVNRKEITGFRMPLPPLKLQEQFAAFVEQTDKSKVAVQKAGMMHGIRLTNRCGME